MRRGRKGGGEKGEGTVTNLRGCELLEEREKGREWSRIE